MQQPLDLKSTLNLPRTSFSMKANLPQNEPKWLAKWREMDLYGLIRQARQGAPLFVLHDGPPYANGRLHLGTALNKILKDFVVKVRTQAGFNAPYLPGWDCHGLPIEINVDKELGPRKLHMSAVEVRRECRKYAEKWVGIQREGFERLAVFGEWDAPYLTMNPDYEAVIAEAFLEFLEKGYVYRGRKSIYWCIRDKTALAEAEVEYEPHRSRSIYVRYELVSDPAALDPALAGRKVWVVIWTTTPWTLPASMAVAFHPDFEYVAAGGPSSDVYILESRRLEPTLAETGLEAREVLARIPGRKLEHLKLRHPFLDRTLPGVLAGYVTAEDGTGCVHTAPGHGREDFETGVRYGLEIYCPVDEAGHLTEGLDAYQGRRVFDANEPIIELLRERGRLVGEPGWLTHSYPHCWRCHQPIIFRASDQWFISIDHDRLRERALEEIRQVVWSPEWGEGRISNMIATRPDWCISRQRVWGVPLVVFHCEACQKPLMDAKLGRRAVELFRREGADAWYSHPVEELVPEGAKCPECGGTKLRKEMDILDVWFDSGSSHLAVLGHRPDLPWPADVYLEAGDQHRGWFHSSLLIGVGTRDAAPYREVLTHGWVLDVHGQAMSKSLGTGIDPYEVVKSHGAEILRLWAGSVDFREDLTPSSDVLAHVSEAYRKLRNTFRYCLSNLYDFDPARDRVDREQLEEIDAWALDRTAAVLEEVGKAYDDFTFHKAYRALYDFSTIELSAFYFDILKDRLYTAPARSVRRRAAQTVLYLIADALVRALAPILCFTADEVWEHLGGLRQQEASVHVAVLVEPARLRELVAGRHRARLANWPRLIELRDNVLVSLEDERRAGVIGGSLEARVRVTVKKDSDWEKLVAAYKDFLPTFLIVSQVEIDIDEIHDFRGPVVAVEKARGRKCARCWNYSERVGENPRYPEVCERCSGALSEIEGESSTAHAG